MAAEPIPGDEKFRQQVEALAERLADRGWFLATAESCTGGWIAKCCTDRDGSSTWFERGFVTYSDRAKQELLGVEAETLRTDGAVSEPVAVQMAEGARRQAGVDAALSVTGIAGPTGGSVEKPVGTVWFAWAVDARDAEAEMVRFDGDRDAVRRQTVYHALAGMLERLGR
jgi:nicotinamide-nucleotide amidase